MATKTGERRKKGIRAIIALQAMVDTKVSPDEAGKGWDKLTEEEKDQTLAAYALFCNRGEESQEYGSQEEA